MPFLIKCGLPGRITCWLSMHFANEAGRVVSEAVAENNWEEIGTLNETPTTAKRTSAMYSVAEKTVTLYQQPYRALVIHSTAHDKRRLKRIGREIKASETTLTKLIAQETKQEFYCRADAESGASRLRESGMELHRIAVSAKEKVHYTRGRPPKNRPRKVAYTLCPQSKNTGESGGTLPGWDNKPTRRPTTFMMSTKLLGIQIVRIAGLCRLAEALTDTQRQYMAALRLSEADLLCCCR